MTSMLQWHSNQQPSRKDVYATQEEFQRLFASKMTDFFRLALHLTADAELAECCLILAIRDCFESSSVSKQWASTWARRMIIRNAIRLTLGAENALPEKFPLEDVSEFHLQPNTLWLDKLEDSTCIMIAPDLDRLVFVICVLERYSIVDCALLVRRSPQEVLDARLRATQRIRSLEAINQAEESSLESDSHGSNRDDCKKELGSSCGAIHE